MLSQSRPRQVSEMTGRQIALPLGGLLEDSLLVDLPSVPVWTDMPGISTKNIYENKEMRASTILTGMEFIFQLMHMINSKTYS